MQSQAMVEAAGFGLRQSRFRRLRSRADHAFAERVADVGACHGEAGNSKLRNIPSLAGQPAFFVLNQLFLMREGVRKVEAMAPIVKDLKDEDLTRCRSILRPRAQTSDEKSTRRSPSAAGDRQARRCVSCHGPNLAVSINPAHRQAAHRFHDQVDEGLS